MHLRLKATLIIFASFKAFFWELSNKLFDGYVLVLCFELLILNQLLSNFANLVANPVTEKQYN